MQNFLSIQIGNVLLGLFVVFASCAAWATVVLVNEDVQKAYELYFEGQKDKAMEMFILKAYEGDPIAQYNLAAIHYQNRSNEPNNSEYKFWLKKAAESGDRDAQFNFAMESYQDLDNNNRFDNTVEWLNRAANNGHVKAQYNLGFLAFSNLEINVSRREGLKWLLKARKAGDRRAKQLVSLLQNNQSAGVPKLYGYEFALKQVPAKKKFITRYDSTKIYPLPASRQIPLQELEKGTEVNIVTRQGRWLGVNVENGFPSWVLKSEVEVSGQTATVSGTEAVLYQDPTDNQRVYNLGTVDNSTSLKVIGQFDNWVKVETPSRFLVWVKESDIASIETIRNVTDSDESSEREDEQAENLSTKKIFKLIDWRPVFDGPESLSKLLGFIPRGTEVKLTQSSGKFVKVEWEGGLHAWIYSKFIEKDGEKVRVIGDNVRVRVLPNTSSSAAIIARLKRNQEFKVTGSTETEDWYRIRISSENSGWIEEL